MVVLSGMIFSAESLESARQRNRRISHYCQRIKFPAPFEPKNHEVMMIGDQTGGEIWWNFLWNFFVEFFRGIVLFCIRQIWGIDPCFLSQNIATYLRA